MGIGDTAGLLFKIKAEETDAVQKLRLVKGEIGSLSDVTKGSIPAFSNLTSTLSSTEGAASGLASVLGPAALAVGALAIEATALVHISSSLIGSVLDLTHRSAEYAGAIYDAQQKTGLHAQTLSALKVAADSSGTSFEAVTGSVSKFNVLLGQAREGNEKAQATLAEYNITSKDTTEALGQAFNAIDKMSSADLRAAAAKDLFRDRTGATLPLIQQLGGDLAAATKEAERLGTTITDRDAEAADMFGDSLKTLSGQAKAAGVAFTSDLMVVLANYFSSVSEWYAENKDETRVWGKVLGDTVWQVGSDFTESAQTIRAELLYISGSMAGNQQRAHSWADDLIEQARKVAQSPWFAAIAFVLGGPLTGVAAYATGAALRGNENAPLTSVIGGRFNPSGVPRLGGGGGRGGGGGGRGDGVDREALKGVEADIKDQKRLLDEAEKAYKDKIATLLDLFKDYHDKAALELGVKDATDQFRDTAAGILAEQRRLEADKTRLSKEGEAQRHLDEQEAKDRTQKVANTISATWDKTNEAIGKSDEKLQEQRLKYLNDFEHQMEETDREIRANLLRGAEDEIKTTIDANQRILKDAHSTKQQRIDAQKAIFEVIQRNARILRDDADAEYEEGIRRLNAWKKAQDDTAAAALTDEQELEGALNDNNNEYERRVGLLKDAKKARTKQIDDLSVIPVTAQDDQRSPLFGLGSIDKELGDLAKGGIADFANGLGQILNNWILLGDAGPQAMRKLTASVLAGLAQQAAVKSLFYLAEGIAALFWNPAEAAGYFTAAAIMAGIAGGSAIAGRAVAGKSFQQQSGAATGTGAAPGAGGGDNTPISLTNGPPRYTQGQGQTQFGWTNGGGPMIDILQKLNQTHAAMSESLAAFNQKFLTASPGAVVIAGAQDAGAELHSAVVDHIADSPTAGETMIRRLGLA